MQRIIDEYRKLLDLSRHLLEAAQAGEWDRAVTLEQERTVAIQSIGALPVLVDPEKQEIARLIEEILQCDAQSAPLIQTEMAELRSMLNSIANERKLGESYL